jgi:Flp pilus assembly protein TadG
MRTRTGPRGDAGSSALELVLLTPLLIALVFGLVQTALVWNARHTVGAAAQHGARLARTASALDAALRPAAVTTAPTAEGAPGAAGGDASVRASTLRVLQQIGGSGLRDPDVIIARDGLYVTVTVSGTTVGVLPGTTVRVSGHSRTPIEGFRP